MESYNKDTVPISKLSAVDEEAVVQATDDFGNFFIVIPAGTCKFLKNEFSTNANPIITNVTYVDYLTSTKPLVSCIGEETHNALCRWQQTTGAIRQQANCPDWWANIQSYHRNYQYYSVQSCARGDVVSIDDKLYEIVLPFGLQGLMLPLDPNFIHGYSHKAGFNAILRSFNESHDIKVVKNVKTNDVSVVRHQYECYQVLHFDEPELQFVLLPSKSLDYSRYCAFNEKYEDTVRVPITRNYFRAIDEVDDDLESCTEYALQNDLNPQRLYLYKKLFEIYDEGDYECIVQVLTVMRSQRDGGQTHRKIMHVKRGVYISGEDAKCQEEKA